VLVILEADRVVEKKLRERVQTQKQNKIAFWRKVRLDEPKKTLRVLFLHREGV
jgi:hypothetical protein